MRGGSPAATQERAARRRALASQHAYGESVGACCRGLCWRRCVVVLLWIGRALAMALLRLFTNANTVSCGASTSNCCSRKRLRDLSTLGGSGRDGAAAGGGHQGDVMSRFKHGELRRPTGELVSDRQEALAIALRLAAPAAPPECDQLKLFDLGEPSQAHQLLSGQPWGARYRGYLSLPSLSGDGGRGRPRPAQAAILGRVSRSTEPRCRW